VTRPTRPARDTARRQAAPAGYRRLGLVGLCVSAALVWLAFADFGVATAAGLSDRQVTTLKRAVIDSKVADQVLAQVDSAAKAALQEAFRMVEAAGIATALRVAGVLAMLSCVVVLWLWHAPDRQ
jgi:hypothetical protein